MDGLAHADKTEILRAFATNILAFDGHNVSQGAARTAKAGITDTIGVTLAGLPEPCTQILLSTPGVGDAPGDSLIFATDKRTSILDAAFINGTASHALDFDDFSAVLGGHQSVPLVAPLFAMAEDHAKSGSELLAAYQVGHEAEHRFAQAVHPHHYDKGWHPTATLGIFGTVAALARLIGLDVNRTTLALAIAASLASGLKANFGTMTKPLHVGHSARAGVMAVLLAERGFDANPGALEHHQGFLNVFNGVGTFDVAPLTDTWTGPLAIDAPSIGIKQFACCGSTHHAIQAAIDLVHQEGVRAEDIDHVRIRVHQQRFRHTNTPQPQSVLEAIFSVQYAVARALVDGAVLLKDFEGTAFRAPEVTPLLSRIQAETFAEGEAQPWDAEVTVTCQDGTTHEKRIDNMVGRSGDNAMSDQELYAKFADCWARALPQKAGAEDAFNKLMALESVADIRRLTALLAIE